MSDELSPEVRKTLAKIRQVIIAEKPSVARDIAETLGLKKKTAQQSQLPFIAESQRLVTWSFGHLLRLAEPHEMNPKWKSWLAEDLPLLPQQWPLYPIESGLKHLMWLKTLLQIRGLEEIVNAMDAGREGELIFQHIYKYCDSKTPVKRMWMNSLTRDAILSAYELRQPQSAYQGLALAAEQRAKADWLIGMNMSRAMSIRYAQPFSIGRVQTPTLSMIVERDQAIADFAQTSFYNLAFQFSIGREVYKALCVNHNKIEIGPLKKEGVFDLSLLREVDFKQEYFAFCEDELPDPSTAKVLEGLTLKLLNYKKRSQKVYPELAADLTTLQKKANELFNFSAQKTLDLAQSLYERHKLISYPRTNSRYLSSSLKDSLADLAKDSALLFKELDQINIDFSKVPLRAIDDSKVDDHHGIIPTKNIADKNKIRQLTSDEAKIFDLVCRYFVGLWLPEFKYETYEFVFETVLEKIDEKFSSSLVFSNESGIKSIVSVFRSRYVLNEGFKILWQDMGKKSLRQVSANLPLQNRQEKTKQAQIPKSLLEYYKLPKDCIIEQLNSLKINSRPPLYFTESTLLSAMQGAGHSLEDKKLKKYLSGKGLGTAATRAGIIESLIDKKYVVRDGRYLKSSDLGRDLILRTLATLKSPQLTAEWEDAFFSIEKNIAYIEKFVPELQDFIRSTIHEMWRDSQAPSIELPKQTRRPFINSKASLSSKLEWGLQEVFKFGQFQAHQRQICEALIGGNDALLVMPTGSGKSLCYQLPALVLGRAALVISPLIALMQDQVQSLQRLGLRAASIHSGLSRHDSRRVCEQLKAGELDYLFITPERLSVPRFCEFLSRCPLSIIAIDEAHCISQWGLDFRPDYRLIDENLRPYLRVNSANTLNRDVSTVESSTANNYDFPGPKRLPLIALTATAKPEVQSDIARQLGLKNVCQIVAGFARKNIAIEVLESPQEERVLFIRTLLAKKENIPAIIYAQTRQGADDLAKTLGGSVYKTISYHAGKTPEQRAQAQEQFMSGKAQVMVATTAFGMGIDKGDVRLVVHTGLVGNLEAYYQEIGRAGRDGKAAKAVMLWSCKDRLTHDYFFQKDFPESIELQKYFKKNFQNKKSSLDKDAGRDRFSVNIEQLSELECNYIQVLRRFQAIRELSPGEFILGRGDWQVSYEAQRSLRHQAVDEVLKFVATASCRMQHLCAYFGETLVHTCGLCDKCNKSNSIGNYRNLVAPEVSAVSALLEALKRSNGQSIGKLYRETFPDERLSKRKFDKILAALQRQGLIHIGTESFTKGQRRIDYQVANLCKPQKIWKKSELKGLELFELHS